MKIRVAKRMILMTRSAKNFAYNRVKVCLPPGVEFIEYMGEKRNIKELESARNSDGFILQVRPPRFPYSLR